MCVLCAYAGDRPAAPVLLEMLRREEGLAGGYYTGLATIHEGTLHYAKVVGDTDTLCRETPAADLPGCIGIAHSRTPSGGGREWSHPFIDCSGKLAYVANGGQGVFAGKGYLEQAGCKLAEAGHRFCSAVPEPVSAYPVLPDGSCIHLSDIMCHLVEEEMKGAIDLTAAMAAAYRQCPSEIVGLALHADDSLGFAAARFNMPLVIGRDGAGIYAASTAIAFPDTVAWTAEMPANCAARISMTDMRFVPFDIAALPVSPMPPPDTAATALIGSLAANGPQGIGELCNAVRPLFADDLPAPCAMLVYQTLTALLREGRIILETERVPGMFGQGTVPKTRARLICTQQA